MNRFTFLPLLITFGILIVFGCGENRSPLDAGKTDPKETGEITFEVTYAPWKPFASKTAAVENIDRATVYVSVSTGSYFIEKNLEIADGRAKGSIAVEARDSLRVALAFFEGETVRYLGEDPVVNVPPRGSTKAEIVEHYMGTDVSSPDSAYVGKSYTISWLSRPFVEWYEVQESIHSDFSDSWFAYSGKDTTCVMEAKDNAYALTTFYYRARVVTQYGPGPWHGSGKTGIAGEEGTIIIDTPLPPDIPPGGSALTLTTPEGGEVFTAGSVRNITWKAFGVSRINIEYSKDLGMTWRTLASSLDAAAGSWTWTLPGELIPGCLVRISDTADPKVTSRTGLPFSIVVQTDPQSLMLAMPNGGETFAAETVREVIWTSRGVDKLNVEFSRDGGKTWILLAMNIAAAPGKFTWNVPDLPSANCFVRVRASADSLISDSSDQKFTLTAITPTVTVISPNGGETFEGFSYIPISWTSTGIDKIYFDYSTDGGATWITGPYKSTQSWQVNTIEWFTVNESSTRCMIRIRDSGQSLVSDVSDRPFTLNQISRSITITSPQDGSILKGDTTYPFSWVGKGAKRENIVNVYFYDYTRWWEWWLSSKQTVIDLNEEGWLHIGTGTAYGDTITFRTPARHDSLYTYFQFKKGIGFDSYDMNMSLSFPTISCKITIAPVQFTIAVSSPNGGESWKEGTPQTIRWTSNYSDSVRIDLSRDGGASWKEIARTKAYLEKYDWTAPNIPSATCLFRISDTKYSEVTDRSDAVFTLLGAAGDAIITVTSPTGGETWEVGSKQKITWTSQSVSKVNIDVSADNGKTWFALATNITASLGSYEGIIPNRVSANCLVRVSDSTNPNVTDVNDAPCAIDSKYTPNITVLTPNGGENLRPGYNQVITWNSTDVRNVRIDYSLDGGTAWLQLVERMDAALGHMLWKVPGTLSSTNCLIRLTDTYNTQVSDRSDKVFSLSIGGRTPVITLLSPKGGEQYLSGTTQTITWKHVDATKVRLELSRDNGNTWKIIATNLAPGSTHASYVDQYIFQGSYSWKVPDIISSDKCKIRISDVNNLELGNLNTQPVFMVFNPGVTMVSIPAGEYSMGGTALNEQPVHRVKVSAFMLSATKITNLQYDTVTGGYDQGYPYNLKPRWDSMSWETAAAFCNRLSDNAGLQRCYNQTTWACDFTRNGYRLPTEAEWEYACRAGSMVDQRDNTAWTTWWDDGPRIVATQQPNAWGLYDMLGNVFEWCNDWWGFYYRDDAVDPTGPASGNLRVIRGGAFWNSNDVRPAWRSNWDEMKYHMVQGPRGYPPSAAAIRVVRK